MMDSLYRLIYYGIRSFEKEKYGQSRVIFVDCIKYIDDIIRKGIYLYE